MEFIWNIITWKLHADAFIYIYMTGAQHTLSSVPGKNTQKIQAHQNSLYAQRSEKDSLFLSGPTWN